MFYLLKGDYKAVDYEQSILSIQAATVVSGKVVGRLVPYRPPLFRNASYASSKYWFYSVVLTQVSLKPPTLSINPVSKLQVIHQPCK